MKHVAGNILTGAALLSTLTGCGFIGNQESSFAAGDREVIQKEFDKGAAFWAKHGIGIANGARLVMLSEAQVEDCGTEKITSGDYDGISYCPNDNKIVIPAAATNVMHDMGSFKGGVKAAVRHELGHMVQASNPALAQQAPNDMSNLIRFSEKQATCLAGVLTYNIDPASIPELFSEFQKTDSDETHGTGAEQAASFAKGHMAQSTNYVAACGTA